MRNGMRNGMRNECGMECGMECGLECGMECGMECGLECGMECGMECTLQLRTLQGSAPRAVSNIFRKKKPRSDTHFVVKKIYRSYRSGKRQYLPNKLKNLPVNDGDRHLFRAFVSVGVGIGVSVGVCVGFGVGVSFSELES